MHPDKDPEVSHLERIFMWLATNAPVFAWKATVWTGGKVINLGKTVGKKITGKQKEEQEQSKDKDREKDKEKDKEKKKDIKREKDKNKDIERDKNKDKIKEKNEEKSKTKDKNKEKNKIKNKIKNKNQTNSLKTAITRNPETGEQGHMTPTQRRSSISSKVSLNRNGQMPLKRSLSLDRGMSAAKNMSGPSPLKRSASMDLGLPKLDFLKQSATLRANILNNARASVPNPVKDITNPGFVK